MENPTSVNQELNNEDKLEDEVENVSDKISKYFKQVSITLNLLDFKCNDCNKSYQYLSSLKEHVKNIHEGRKFICNFCDNGFKSKPYLRLHIMKNHEAGLNSPHCDVCRKNFTNKTENEH